MNQSYQIIEQALRNQQSLESAAQLHGRICGLLCGNSRLEPDSIDAAKQLYSQVEKQLAEQFNDDSLQFQLLLPDDEQSLAKRTRGLAHWCQSFLSGLGEAEIDAAWFAQKENAALLKDIEGISHAASDKTDEANLSDEQAYIELVDYLRLAVANFYVDNVLIPQQKA